MYLSVLFCLFKTTSDFEHRQTTSAPIQIPHSSSSLPFKPFHPTTNNVHSRSMDFQSFIHKRNANSSNSSSTGTLTSFRSSTSLEFDDNIKPSGVLVDDDFLPMSSPVDDHFWDLASVQNKSIHQDSFPNVGSSPDLEVKRFDLQNLSTLDETSCDEDDDDDENDEQSEPPKFLRMDSVIKAKSAANQHYPSRTQTNFQSLFFGQNFLSKSIGNFSFLFSFRRDRRQ